MISVSLEAQKFIKSQRVLMQVHHFQDIRFQGVRWDILQNNILISVKTNISGFDVMTHTSSFPCNARFNITSLPFVSDSLSPHFCVLMNRV